MINATPDFRFSGLKDKEFRRELLLVFISIFVGIVGGVGAIIFRSSTEITSDMFHAMLAAIPFLPVWLSTILLPGIGGLLCGFIVFRFAKEAKGHGVPEIIDSVNFKGGSMRYRVPFIKIIASAITIGSGGSAGSEGPIAQIGGGFGSLIGQVFHLKQEERKIMVISGTSAGIAAIFNAPIGGILFGVEIIRRDKKMFSPFPLIMATVVGTTVTQWYYDASSVFNFPDLQITVAQILSNLHLFILLGIIIGAYTVFWIRGFYYLEFLFEKIPTSPILVAGLGGLLVGVIELFVPDVDGSIGYGPINQALSLGLAIQMLIILTVAKFLATSFSIGSGGSGGVFAPTLMQGVFLGAAFGLLIQPLSNAGIIINIFAVLGMAALFASSTKAPLTTIIMTSEMIGHFNLFVPLLFTVVTSWIISTTFLADDIYIFKLKRQGFAFTPATDLLEELQIEDIMTHKVDFVTPSQSMNQIREMMTETGHTGFPVIADGRLFGIITDHDVDFAIKQIGPDAMARDVCTRDVITVTRSCPVSLAAQQIMTQGINRLPVVDKKEPEVVIGWISRSDILKAYHKSKSSRRLEYTGHRHFERLVNPVNGKTHRKVLDPITESSK